MQLLLFLLTSGKIVFQVQKCTKSLFIIIKYTLSMSFFCTSRPLLFRFRFSPSYSLPTWNLNHLRFVDTFDNIAKHNLYHTINGILYFNNFNQRTGVNKNLMKWKLNNVIITNILKHWWNSRVLCSVFSIPHDDV